MKIHDHSTIIEIEQKPNFDVKNRCLEFPQIMGVYDWKKITVIAQENQEHSYFKKALVGTFYRFTSLITSMRCWENTSITVNHESKGIVVLTYPECDIVSLSSAKTDDKFWHIRLPASKQLFNER